MKVDMPSSNYHRYKWSLCFSLETFELEAHFLTANVLIEDIGL